MTINLDLLLWKKSNLALTHYVLLQMLYEGIDPSTYMRDTSLSLCKKYLMENEYLYMDNTLTGKAIKLLAPTINIEELAQKVQDLFPSGVQSGGKYVKADVNSIKNKLKKFLTDYKKKKYTVEQILEATKTYVSKKEAEGYAYMRTAPFFIEKNGNSDLATEIENLGTEIDNNVIIKMI